MALVECLLQHPSEEPKQAQLTVDVQAGIIEINNLARCLALGVILPLWHSSLPWNSGAGERHCSPAL